MSSVRLGVLGLAAFFTLGMLGLALWFAHEPRQRSASSLPDTQPDSVASAPAVIDPALRDRHRRALGTSMRDEDAPSSAQSAAPGSSGEATLEVRIADVPAGSQWNITIDVQGLHAGQPVRRSAQDVHPASARFERVPVGAVVDVLAMESHGKQKSIRMRVDPPLVACEKREMVLAQPLEPAIVFRVLDPSGRPCKEAWIGARIAHGLSSHTSDDLQALHTDANGSARLVLAAPEGAVNGRWLCVHAHDLRDADGNTSSDHLACEVPLLRELARRDTDIGDVRLEPEPVVASGIVALPPDQGFSRSVTVAAVVIGPTVEDSIVLETHVDSEGRFEVRSALRGGVIALRAAPEPGFNTGLLPGPLVTVQFGTHDIRLTIEFGGSMSGSVVGAELRPPTIQVRCSNSAGSDDVRCWVGAGPFHFSALNPGRYRVELRLSGETLSAVPLIATDGVLVTATETSLDPRLQSMDVTPLVRQMRIDLVDEKGQRVLEGTFRTLRGGVVVGRGEWTHGRIDVAVKTDPIDVELEAPGFEIARGSDVHDGQQIVMKRGRLLHLKLASRDLLETLQNVCVFVRLVPEGEPSGRTELRSFLDQGGETNFTDVAAGKWRVELELDVDSESPGPHVAVRSPKARIVKVGQARTIEFPLDVGEDEIAIARAALPD